MSNRCKDCGREERGYESLLNSDGYCFACSYKHYDELKKERDELVRKTYELVQKMHILGKKLDIAMSSLGQIAIHSDNRTDAVQAAIAISEIEEV